LSRKTRVLGAAHSQVFVIRAYTVLIQSQSVTDGRTPGHGYDAWSILLSRVIKNSMLRKQTTKLH